MSDQSTIDGQLDPIVIQDLPKDYIECEEWIFKKCKSVQDCWSTLEQKYKDLVFKLVDYINENVVIKDDLTFEDFCCQAEPIISYSIEKDDQLKLEYEKLVEDIALLK